MCGSAFAFYIHYYSNPSSPLYLWVDDYNHWELGVKEDVGDGSKIYGFLIDNTEKFDVSNINLSEYRPLPQLAIGKYGAFRRVVYWDDQNNDSRLDNNDTIMIGKPNRIGDYNFILVYNESYEVRKIGSIKLEGRENISSAHLCGGLMGNYWYCHLHMDGDALIEDCAIKLLLNGEVVEGYDNFTVDTYSDLTNYSAPSNIVILEHGPNGLLDRFIDNIYVKMPEIPGDYRVELYIQGIFAGGEPIKVQAH